MAHPNLKQASYDVQLNGTNAYSFTPNRCVAGYDNDQMVGKRRQIVRIKGRWRRYWGDGGNQSVFSGIDILRIKAPNMVPTVAIYDEEGMMGDLTPDAEREVEILHNDICQTDANTNQIAGEFDIPCDFVQVWSATPATDNVPSINPLYIFMELETTDKNYVSKTNWFLLKYTVYWFDI